MRSRILGAALLLIGWATVTVPGGSATGAAPARLAVPGLPLSVTPVVDGLSIPWDIAFAWDGTMFFTERPGRIGVRLVDGTRRHACPRTWLTSGHPARRG